MRIEYLIGLFLLPFTLLLSSCSNPEKERYEAYIKEGEDLAKTHCTTCHKESSPGLLDKKTWVFDVLPQMGPRLGMHKYKNLHYKSINPLAASKTPALKQEQWENIVDYFYYTSPDSLPEQEFDRKPSADCETFLTHPFTDGLSLSSVITVTKIDTLKQFVFAGDATNSTLYKFDYTGKLLDTMKLASPPTSMRIEPDYIDMTLAGILHPNNENRGQIVRYEYKGNFNSEKKEIILDSLYRPVASLYYDFNYDGLEDILVCEYGNDIGRLSLYTAIDKDYYKHVIIEDVAGSIMVKTHDFNNDGFMDIIALFAQGDEKVMIYYNDGKGDFLKKFSLAARFPSVYGSMYLDIHDFNKDGFMDIVYVNGDNFDFSQILKQYHGIRILENDGYNNFDEKYFYPVYGAGKAEIVDFDLDGDSDIIVSSNFADMKLNPERGIIYLENIGSYQFMPYSFAASAQNQWNNIAVADLDADGDQDVIVGAMNLENVFNMAKKNTKGASGENKSPLLILENKTY